MRLYILGIRVSTHDLGTQFIYYIKNIITIFCQIKKKIVITNEIPTIETKIN